MKKIIGSMLAATIVFSSVALTGCNGKGKVNSESEQTLEIYVYNAGYGTDWLYAIKDEFVKEAWVKEKYPELVIDITQNEVEKYASDMLTASESTNKFEIIMGQVLNKHLGANGKAEDLTDTVYKANVFGEDVTVEEKMYESTRKSNVDVDINKGENDSDKYYSYVYAGGMTGIVYNEDKLNALGKSVPNTTDELIQILKDVKAMNSGDNKNTSYSNSYSFLTYGASIYTNYVLSTWWAQYQGSQGYVDFFNGYDESTNSISSSVLSQEGRLESLKVLEEIMSKNNGYTNLNPSSGREAYRETQNNLLLGKGLFMANGDWFDNEMKVFREGLISANGRCDTIKMMKTPVISSIIKQTSTINDDKTLSAVITAIDNGETSYPNVSAEDFQRILKARVCVYSIGPGHNAVVPKTAKAKTLAYDFLIYMATDKANEAYIKATNGASLPFNYDCKAKNPTLFESLSPMQKDRLEFFNNYQTEVDILPATAAFPLVLFGGLAPYKSCGDQPGYHFLNGDSKGSYATLAEKIFYDDVNYWTEEFDRRWNNALALAGL